MPEPPVSTPSTLQRTRSQLLSSEPPTPGQVASTDVFGIESKPSSTTKLITSFRPSSTPPERLNGKYRIMQGTNRNRSATTEIDPSWLRTTLSKKKSQYYDEAFACREVHHSIRTRAFKDALISAEVRLNCCVDSEENFLIDFAFLLSEVYQRPAECVMVLMNTDFSMILHNSSDPAYKISITAPESEIAVTKNRRTAGLIQDFMAEAVKLPADRGVLFFHAMEEGNIIVHGLLNQEDKEMAERDHTEEHGIFKIATKQRSRRTRKSSTVNPATMPNDIVVASRGRSSSFKPETSSIEAVSTTGMDKRKVKKRKSLMALLGF